MGEAQFVPSQTSQACQEAIKQCEQIADEAMRVQTPGGVFEVQFREGREIYTATGLSLTGSGSWLMAQRSNPTVPCLIASMAKAYKP